MNSSITIGQKGDRKGARTRNNKPRFRKIHRQGNQVRFILSLNLRDPPPLECIHDHKVMHSLYRLWLHIYKRAGSMCVSAIKKSQALSISAIKRLLATSFTLLDPSFEAFFKQLNYLNINLISLISKLGLK